MLLGLVGGHRGGSVSPEKDPPVLWAEAGWPCGGEGRGAGWGLLEASPSLLCWFFTPRPQASCSPARGPTSGSRLGDGGRRHPTVVLRGHLAAGTSSPGSPLLHQISLLHGVQVHFLIGFQGHVMGGRGERHSLQSSGGLGAPCHRSAAHTQCQRGSRGEQAAAVRVSPAHLERC